MNTRTKYSQVYKRSSVDNETLWDGEYTNAIALNILTTIGGKNYVANSDRYGDAIFESFNGSTPRELFFYSNNTRLLY